MSKKGKPWTRAEDELLKKKVFLGAPLFSISGDLALQLPFLTISESMGNHDSKIVDAGSVD